MSRFPGLRHLLAGVAMTAALAATMGVAQGADKVKAGFVYVGPVNDNGWTYRHNVGRLEMEEALGDKADKSTYVENVPEGADAERVIQQLAASGHNLIFTTSFGFMNPTLKVAQRFPNVKFEHATGFKRADNVSTYNARFYEGRAVAGLLAGRMTKTKVIGYIGSFPIPEVVQGIDATTIALRKIVPDAVVKVVWVNTWVDPGKEADAAKALIDQGADVILQHTDSSAPCQVAQERGVWCVGQAADQSRFAPKAHLTAIVDEWGPYYIARAEAVADGTWTSTDVWGGLKDGYLSMAPFNPAIPAAIREEAEKAIEDIIAGRLHPFQGPIKNQAGEEVVKAGDHLGDDKLVGLDWYVEGVQGQLPK